MNIKKRKSFLLSLLLCFSVGLQAQEIKIMSFNMQQPYGTNWDGRVTNAADIINTHQPDILGSQELHAYMRDQILSKVSGYSAYGNSRECDGSGESSYIFYKTSKYEIDSTNSGTFWFKDDYLICGRGYDTKYNRICTYARFKDKTTGRYFYIYNSHFPTLDLYTARLKSAILLCQLASNRSIKDPLIFTGDFNSKEGEKDPIEYIKNGSSLKMRDTYREIHPTGYATTGFNSRYDYIFIEDQCSNSTLSSNIINTPTASDHFPIVATVLLDEPKDSVVPLKLVTAKTSLEGDTLILIFNNELKDGITINTTDFSISGRTGLSIDSIIVGSKEIKMTIKGEIMHDDSLRLTYNGNDISDTSNSILPTFSDLTILNRIPPHSYIPGKIEAENFYLTMGIDEDITNDTGGGNYVGWTDAGDYTEYLIYVNSDTNYIATFRGAVNNGGKAELSLVDNNVKSKLCSITFKNTGGWEKWSDFQSTDTFKLSKGKHLIRFTVISSGFNINYFNIVIPGPKATSIESNYNSPFKIFPNPSNGELTIQCSTSPLDILVFDMGGKTMINKRISSNQSRLDLNKFSKGVYLVKSISGYNCFTQKIVIE